MAHPNRNKREAREEKERREWYENLTLGTAIVGVAVISISTVVTAWMGWIMVQQLRVMEFSNALGSLLLLARCAN